MVVVRDYGSLSREEEYNNGGRKYISAKFNRRLLVAVGCLGAVAVVSLTLGMRSRTKPTVLDLPPDVADLFDFVNMSEKDQWMTTIMQNAQNLKTLQPNSDLDPFTHQPLSPETNIESNLRALKTKNVSYTIAKLAADERKAAQQNARDVTGADVGCTHNLQNQIDYTGTISMSVNGATCAQWAEVNTTDLTNTSFLPSLAVLETMANYCRNPGGSRLGAWCFLDTFPEVDVEGLTWEYCDVGSRCAVDIPILAELFAGEAKADKSKEPMLKQILSQPDFSSDVPLSLSSASHARSEHYSAEQAEPRSQQASVPLPMA